VPGGHRGPPAGMQPGGDRDGSGPAPGWHFAIAAST
jgi:hypothetical protein